MKISENAYISAFYEDRGSPALLITFCEMSFRYDGSNYWGQELAQKLGLSVLGLVSRRTWFPHAPMLKCAPSWREIIKRHPVRVGYGASMGGYGVLKHSRLLDLTHSIAVSPQYSIAPDVVGDFDQRYLKYYRPIHGDMSIKAADLAGERYIAYDPYNAPDRRHVELILEEGDFHLLPAFHTGHATIRALASSATIQDLISACVLHGPGRTRRVFNQTVRRSSFRLLSLCADLPPRHARTALSVLERYDQLPARQKAGGAAERANLLMRIGHSLRAAGYFEEGTRVLKTSKEIRHAEMQVRAARALAAE